MSIELFYFLLILHLLADFHLQTEAMAEHKAASFSGVLIHARVLALVALFGAILLAAFGTPIMLSVLLMAVLFLFHFLLDTLKYYLGTVFSGARADASLFVLDQGLHIFLIWLFADVVLTQMDLQHQILFDIPHGWLSWLLLALIVTKPANVSFKKMFVRYQVQESLDDENGRSFPEPGAGALIGNLERLLSILFMGVGQYAAIGLVFTAKSIARFRQIEQNKRFAEYYLIGTLYSMLYAVGAYALIFFS
ncbi:MAG TPA: DUF3307 domain-containing protein [Fastidiosipila sp.]|jgi:hypothetical protein|nr:DUF3307 domain-containing protein [Fastidiosipila sp.]